jgi:hypothetical protein
MKTKAAKLALLLTATFLMGLNLQSGAQSRGRDRGHEQHQAGNQHNGSYHNDRNYSHNNDRHASYYDHRGSAYNQPSYRRLPPQRVVVYQQHAPRYVYYRDYNVYYDYTRNAYISFSGRNWVVTTTAPVGMRYVNRSGLNCSNIDYYNDDFPQYLDRGGWSY